MEILVLLHDDQACAYDSGDCRLLRYMGRECMAIADAGALGKFVSYMIENYAPDGRACLGLVSGWQMWPLAARFAENYEEPMALYGLDYLLPKIVREMKLTGPVHLRVFGQVYRVDGENAEICEAAGNLPTTIDDRNFARYYFAYNDASPVCNETARPSAQLGELADFVNKSNVKPKSNRR